MERVEELKETQTFVFLHSKDNSLGWDGEDGWTADMENWWKTADLQEFGNKQMELTMQGLVYRPVVMEMVPEQLTEGPDSGKWVLAIQFYPATLQMSEEEAD